MLTITKIFFYTVLMILFLTCNSSGTKQRGDSEVVVSARGEIIGPEITFDILEHNFGKVREGEKVGWYFKYSNTGDKPLIITSANASCGCTVPEYHKEPLPPGKEGLIKVVFDTSGRSGKQTKTVTIESNAPQMTTLLRVKAEIVSY